MCIQALTCREKPHLMRSSSLLSNPSPPFPPTRLVYIFLAEIFRQPVFDKYFRRHVHMRSTSSKNFVLFQKHASLPFLPLFTCPSDSDNFDANHIVIKIQIYSLIIFFHKKEKKIKKQLNYLNYLNYFITVVCYNNVSQSKNYN